MAQTNRISGHNGRVSSATGAMRNPVTVNRPDLTKVGGFVWLSSELMFFVGLFAIYVCHRAVAGSEEFNERHAKIDFTFSVINTSILVLSSIAFHSAV